MTRLARIDAPGALHHIIARGIDQQKIFNDDADRDAFLERFSCILKETDTACYAWALMCNHFHLLLRTGPTPLSTIMRRLLTGYAMGYNRRHCRVGHLFQNRYKSILCQDEPYLLELVRYIHLNPLRVKAVPDLNHLDDYQYTGHSKLMGKKINDWQKVDEVLLRFSEERLRARIEYRQFIQEGLPMGKRPDLIGGGLVRSVGGWSEVKALRKAKANIKGDERILGDSDFVQAMLKQYGESYERRYQLKAKGVNLDAVALQVSKLLDIPIEDIWSKGKHRHIVAARSLLCYWAVNDLYMSQSQLAQKFELSATAISKAVLRGKTLAMDNDYQLRDIAP